MPMDTSCGSLSSKKQILLGEQGIDKLSNLPDCILHHVLSLLKAKDVVRTSILSRRWRYLWTCVANIDLEYSISYKIEDKEQRKNLGKCFLEFMDRLFILHNTSNTKELRLKFSIDVDNFRLNSWICAVMEHNVQFLDLDLEVKGRPTLPLCLFDHHSFVVLKLNLECNLKAPVGTLFPYLKKLSLSRARFMDDVSIKCLFSNCPVLDELALMHCEWENIQNVTISIPSLRNLTIEGDVDDEYYSRSNCHEFESNSHVKFVATNLACLTFSRYLDINFEVSGLSSLEAASICLPCEGMGDEIETRSLRLLSQITNVENLTLWAITVETLLYAANSLDYLPTFNNLTRLTVHWMLDVDCSEFLLAFLDKMPKLEYLRLSEGCDKTRPAEELYYQYDKLPEAIVQKRVPTCFNSSLKTFAIECFEAGQLEILMIEYMLRNATILESLFISSWKHRDACKSLSKAKAHILKLPRGSGSCNIVLSFKV